MNKIMRSGAILASALMMLAPVSSNATPLPDYQQATLMISGLGIPPLSEVKLLAGKKQELVSKADKDGRFTFSGLQYYSYAPLELSLYLPEQSTETIRVKRTLVDIIYNPSGSYMEFKGNIAPQSTIAVNVDGQRATSRISNEKGEFEILESTPLGLSDGTSVASINISNLGEACCPKMRVPVMPVQISFSSIPLKKTDETQGGYKEPENAKPTKSRYLQVPENAKEDAKQYNAAPQQTLPIEKNGGKESQEKEKKSPAPYMVLGESEIELNIDVPTATMANFEATWVGGYKKLTDEVRAAIVGRAMMIGAFIDGRSELASLSVIQRLNAGSIKNYHVSDQICRFGTLSRSIAETQERADANKLVFSKLFLDRNAQQKNLLYTEATMALNNILDDFKSKYCMDTDANGGLEGYCNSIMANPDEFYGKDIDYTRVFDTPLTLNVDFTDNSLTNDEQAVMALFHNISYMSPNYGTEDGKQIVKPDKSDDLQNMHQMNAVRQLVANTFANQVALKAKGNNKSATYMHNVIKGLGLSDADAKKLIGENPSYNAQMEVLTKKIYQDPEFYVNLYDTPQNVDRQKVAMLAIQLMQERDLLETYRRKEMLLSELLEMKLRQKQTPIDRAAASADE
ncbi:MAG: hypothetical protein KDJ50_07345 [Alphaproteobacteria bacterium]|nr:hypothetical protein [Alphaproteobacteria bacterium]